MLKVSIIVPVYNSEKTLEKCLESILKQTLRDIEILCIDDECKDNSRSIIDRYAEIDKRIKPIHLTGKGSYGRAVNIGIKKANAEYIGIVESDDCIKPEMYEILYNLAKSKDAEVSTCSYYVLKKNNYEYWDYTDNVAMDKEGVFNAKTSPSIIDKAAYPWKHLYKKSFLIQNNIFFQEDLGGSFQDNIFYSLLVSKAARIVATKEPLYFYDLTNETSSSNNDKALLLYPLRKKQARDVLIENNMLSDSEFNEYFWKRAYISLQFFFNQLQKNKSKYYRSMRKTMSLAKKDKLSFKYFSKREQKDFKLILKTPNLFFYNIVGNIRRITLSNIFIKLAWLIKMIDFIFPKQENCYVFFSSPDFGDNAKALFDYIVEKKDISPKTIYFLYANKWWKKNIKSFPELFASNEKIKLRTLHLFSIKALIALIKSKKYILTERIPVMYKCLSSRHIIMNFWHGMTIKTIGHCEKNIAADVIEQYKFLGKNSYLFVTSDIFKSIMANSFAVDINRVYITGQPRTDCILNNNKYEMLDNCLNLSKYSKIILYAPTYREFNRANDTEYNIFKNIFYLDDYNEANFYQYLKDNNILLLFKPHLFDEPFYNRYKKLINFNHPNVQYINDIFLKRNNFSLYELFKYTDALITDFSSISIDYLITKKPVIYMLSGETDYGKTRGYSLEDNWKILCPGLKAHTYSDLINCIKDVLGRDSLKEERLKSLPLLHKYMDSNSSERVLEIIRKI